jgi:hypothetical protein
VITGFNTDIEHDGVVYHVQTEDKGLDSPLILSLVYAGGAILASKRTPYQDLIAAGFNEEALAERLKRQHKLICAAIRAGRVNDLKRMSGSDSSRTAASTAETGSLGNEITIDTAEFTRPTLAQQEFLAQQESIADSEVINNEAVPETTSVEQVELTGSSRKPRAPSKQAEAYSIHDPRRQSPLGELEPTSTALMVSLLDERDFFSGEALNLRIMVSSRVGENDRPKAGVPVSVKVLGTTFRPQIYSVKTQRDGVAIISGQIPEFNSGRAAILIRVVSEGEAVELRRVIHSSR